MTYIGKHHAIVSEAMPAFDAGWVRYVEILDGLAADGFVLVSFVQTEMAAVSVMARGEQAELTTFHTPAGRWPTVVPEADDA